MTQSVEESTPEKRIRQGRPEGGDRFDFVRPFLPPPEDVVALALSVDTLKLMWSCPLNADLVEELRELKAQAGKLGPHEVPPVKELCGIEFTVKRNATIKGEILLTSPVVDVHLAPRAPENGASIYAELHADLLWGKGPLAAAAMVQQLVFQRLKHKDATPRQLRAKVSRLDLSCDFQGWSPHPTELELQRKWSRFQCRARKSRSYEGGREGRYSGQSYGTNRGSAIYGIIYNKSLEIEDKKHKRYMYDVWAKNGYDPEGGDVHRAEFRLQREALREFIDLGNMTDGNFDSWEQVSAHLSAIWKYLTTRWLVMHGQRTKKSRTIHPVWQKIVDARPLHTAEAQLLRWKLEKEDADLVASVVGYVSSRMAQRQWAARKPLQADEVISGLVVDIQKYALRTRTLEARAEEKLKRHRATEHCLLLGSDLEEAA